MTDDIVARLRAYVASEAKYDAEAHLDPDVAEAAADEIERLRAALHEWDALIRHQYNGSREAMSDMTYAAQRTANILHGEEPWPMQTRVEKMEAALREIAEGPLDADKSYVSLIHELQSKARAALAGEHIADAGKKVATQEAPTALAGEKTNEPAPGYEHLTPKTVQAIRGTCSTPASRVGKTQAEVFKDEETP